MRRKGGLEERTLLSWKSWVLILHFSFQTCFSFPRPSPSSLQRKGRRAPLPQASSPSSIVRRRTTQNRQRHQSLLRLSVERNEGDGEEVLPLHDVFVIDWDGCLVDTRDWRIEAALAIAKSAWPSLDVDLLSTLTSSSNISTRSTLSWLENKLKALAHVFYVPSGDNPSHSLTCEYALAARLLLEEQKLDQGRSNGRSGKYASRFHPQPDAAISSNDKTEPRRRSSPSPSGSRPLTVGEIAANWRDGGMLRDTLLTRYHCDYRNPMPVLQDALNQHLSTYRQHQSISVSANATSPRILPDILHQLHQCNQRCTVIVLVRHASDLAAAVESFAVARLPFRIVSCLSQVQAQSISLLVPNESTMCHLLQACPTGSHVYVTSSCWNTLQRYIPLMGDDVPQQQRIPSGPMMLGLGRTPYGSYLSLSYAEWSPNSHPTLQAAATMNPWTRLTSLSEWEELTSFQMTS